MHLNVNNNIESCDNSINGSQVSVTTENKNGFDIRSFNSYSQESTQRQWDNTPPCEAEGTFYTPINGDGTGASPLNAAEAANEYKKESRRRFSYIGFMIAAMYLVYNVAIIFLVTIYSVFSGDMEISNTAAMIIGSSVTAFVGFPFMALVLAKIKTPKTKKKNLSIGRLGLFLTMTFTAMYLGAYIGMGFSGIIEGILGNEGEAIVSGSLEGVPIWVTIVFTCVFPGIFEELIFRKLIMDKTKEFGFFASALFSAFTFGVFHGNFEQFFYAFFVGLVFAYIYARTGRIIYTIILHFAMNFFGSALGMLVEGNNGAILIYNMVLSIVWIVGVVALIYEIVDNRKKLGNDVGIRTVGSGNAVIYSMVNPGTLTFLIIFSFIFATTAIQTFGG